jgi:uncharacterized protein YfbU (UPF0304 family)
MPLINVRLDDETKQQLETLAFQRNQTLSALIRGACDSELGRSSRTETSFVPKTLTPVERILLSEIHKLQSRLALDEPDRVWHSERISVLENGFVSEYEVEFQALRSELSARDCHFVVQILGMYQRIVRALGVLQTDASETDAKLQQKLTFLGFDLNDSYESHLHSYAKHLVSEDRFSELQLFFSSTTDAGNSHMPVTAIYRRMLVTLAEIDNLEASAGPFRKKMNLNSADLESLRDAMMLGDNLSKSD